jgi:hypothetical protein
MIRSSLGLILLCFLLVTGACGAKDSSRAEVPLRIFDSVPGDVDLEARYLFYLHGRIIEEQGIRPTHPEFGSYEYEEILHALANRGFVVIAEARPSGADTASYSRQVAEQVRTLLAAGVPPEHITVVGFSKGGAIAILASSLLDYDRLNFAFIASCGSWYADRLEIVPRGRLLGIREASDDLAGPCDALFARSQSGADQKEIVLALGGGHGAFYRPRPEWIDIVAAWALVPD